MSISQEQYVHLISEISRLQFQVLKMLEMLETLRVEVKDLCEKE